MKKSKSALKLDMRRPESEPMSDFEHKEEVRHWAEWIGACRDYVVANLASGCSISLDYFEDGWMVHAYRIGPGFKVHQSKMACGHSVEDALSAAKELAEVVDEMDARTRQALSTMKANTEAAR